MRLVIPTAERRPGVGQKAFEQLRDVGDRLDYITARYRRILSEALEGRPLPDVAESLEMMNNQLGYVARQLQDVLVARYEGQHDAGEADEGAGVRPAAMAAR